MSFPFNPIAASVVQAPQTSRQQAAARVRQALAVRSASDVPRDRYDHQVEGSEEVSPLHDEARQQSRQQKPSSKPAKQDDVREEEGHVDITA